MSQNNKMLTSPDQLASAARVLEELLPHGYSLTHTRHRWWLKLWSPGYTNRYGEPRMAWADVDDDASLPALLGRLREHS